jgi:hypothetical protein
MTNSDLFWMQMQLAIEPLWGAVAFGLVVGVALAVIVGAARIGFKFAGWIVAAAIVLYFLDFI